MKILRVLIILCSLIILSSSFADDDYNDDHRKKSDNKIHIFRSLEYLGLNKIQYEEIKKILIVYKKDYKKFYKFKRSRQKELQELMQNDLFDKAKYIDIHNEIKTYSVQLEANKFEKIHKVLSSKQRIKFSYFLGEWEVD
ncbi:MAG: hypothetical protein CL624_03850 [Arcobacter sp.]|nr:hypothetical protein [Arcobacter sp.]|tara:strand:- start:10936 stop:11355 length:420 start_codon:yes stop_codon:yes gene_type:complete